MRSKKIFFILASIIIAFLAAELATRALLSFNGRGFFKERRFVSPWFTTYDTPAPQEKDGFLYFKRGQKAAKIPPPNTIRIICLGGSTTVNLSTKTHYPAVLQDKLNGYYKNVRFEVLNAGGDGFSSAHSLVNLSLRLLYCHPDCIIVYHNINDLSANYFPPLKTDYATKYMDNLFLAPECKAGIERWLSPSRLISRFMIKFDEFDFTKRSLAASKTTDIAEGKKIFESNLTNIVAVAKAHNINVILATQAACFEYAKKYPYIKKADFLEYNNVIKDVAKKQSVAIADCFGGLGERPEYFIDLVHYTESGIEKVSDVFSQTVEAAYPDVPKTENYASERTN